MESRSVKAFLDTHAAIMLWNGEPLGAASEDLLERSAIFVSPVVRLELRFLEEIGRLKVPADEILGTITAELGVSQSDDPLDAVVAEAMGLDWTRDPFDRLLVATAILHRAPFVTKDQRILASFGAAVW